MFSRHRSICILEISRSWTEMPTSRQIFWRLARVSSASFAPPDRFKATSATVSFSLLTQRSTCALSNLMFVSRADASARSLAFVDRSTSDRSRSISSSFWRIVSSVSDSTLAADALRRSPISLDRAPILSLRELTSASKLLRADSLRLRTSVNE